MKISSTKPIMTRVRECVCWYACVCGSDECDFAGLMMDGHTVFGALIGEPVVGIFDIGIYWPRYISRGVNQRIN